MVAPEAAPDVRFDDGGSDLLKDHLVGGCCIRWNPTKKVPHIICLTAANAVSNSELQNHRRPSAP